MDDHGAIIGARVAAHVELQVIDDHHVEPGITPIACLILWSGTGSVPASGGSVPCKSRISKRSRMFRS
jgi:hypothetical protein